MTQAVQPEQQAPVATLTVEDAKAAGGIPPRGSARLLKTLQNPQHTEAQAFLGQILGHYAVAAPGIVQLLDALAERTYPGAAMFHDHLAFRTFGVPGLGIQSIAAVVERLGYRQSEDRLLFPGKKLVATWFAPPDDAAYAWLPRLFVSELEVGQLPAACQAILARYLPALTGASTPVAAQEQAACVERTRGALVGAQHRLWESPSSSDYDALMKDSDYAAWTLFHGYALNHTALSIHRMAGCSGDMHDFAQRMAGEMAMNMEGGLIKISPDGLLLQCSTLSTLVEACFADDVRREIAGPYIEFVERRAPAALQHVPRSQLAEAQLRDGFEVGNADKIFDSTKGST